MKEATIINNNIEEKINSLDFKMIKLKLMNPDEGLGWTKEQANIAELEYKRFLTLNLLFPNKSIVPNKLMDNFWHSHILDTRKYYSDCKSVFGYFLHHFPYFGLRGEKDKLKLIDAFEETKKLYQITFGKSMHHVEVSFPATCDTGNGGSCNTC